MADNTAIGVWSTKASLPDERFRFSAAPMSISGADFVFVTGGQLPQATTRADIPWDTAAAVAAVGNTITVDAETQLVFAWTGNHNVVRVADAASLATCSLAGAQILADSAANGLDLSAPPTGASAIYLASSVGGDCAGGFKLTITVRDAALVADWHASTWSAVDATLSVARSDHTAAVWPEAGHPNSKVYIAGELRLALSLLSAQMTNQQMVDENT